MEKDIKYAGISRLPSDFESEDGQLALSLNAGVNNGAIRTVYPPKEIMEIPGGFTLVYIHETVNTKRYILQETLWDEKHTIVEGYKFYYWFGEETEQPKEISGLDLNHVKIHQINAIGNSLLVLCDDAMHYILWKTEGAGTYKYLGTHFPETSISFGLQGTMAQSDIVSIALEDQIPYNESFKELKFSERDKKSVTDSVLAKVNKFIAEESLNKGKFLYPFILRWAYRMYDGSLTMHSAPILMVCSSDLAPEAILTDLKLSNGKLASFKTKVVGVLQTIDYAVSSADDLNLLKDWKDIIRSVDVFVSSPIYTYDQNGECEGLRQILSKYNDTYSICKLEKSEFGGPNRDYQKYHQRWTINQMYHYAFPRDVNANISKRVMLPKKTQAEIVEDIRDCANFYFLTSLKLDSLKTERTKIEIKEDYLQSLSVRERMTDDYDSHDNIIPKYSFEYNARLNIANLSKKVFNGFPPHACMCYCDGYYNPESNTDDTLTGQNILFYYFIKQGEKEFVVCTGMSDWKSPDIPLFLYYPNINAHKVVIGIGAGGHEDFFERELVSHNSLNGSLFFTGWECLDLTSESVPRPIVSSNTTTQLPNKIYTSEVNNPFYFPLLGINTIGTGTILGLASATKAISEGQFGQFPLYAFSTDGVWALEVSDTGGFSSKQPVSRDVCINPKSITQIDSGVLFATERGVMMLESGQCQCITDILDGDNFFMDGSTLALPALEQTIRNIYGNYIAIPEQPIKDFVRSAEILYDYTNQRIILYKPRTDIIDKSDSIAYVYNIKDSAWLQIRHSIHNKVRSYPEALAMTVDGSLIDYCKQVVTPNTNGLLITRPFKLSSAADLKTIETIVQRGTLRRDSVKQILYGSRDGFNWFPVYSSSNMYLRGFRGTPFKLFCLVLFTNMDKDESLSGCSVDFEVRHNNQLR